MSSLGNSSIPGVTAPNTNLESADADNLLPQPVVGDSLEERLVYYGNIPPVKIKAETIALEGNLTDAGIGSILPWTPHPQHSYKDNSNRVRNRTGRERPNFNS